VKLADFGISKRTGSAVTTVTEAIGTFDYMAPEILSQDKDTPAIDHKAADIWALGATTFYLMTKSRSYLTWRSAYNVTPLIDNIFPDGCEISPRGRAFVLQLMLRDPKERPKCHEATLHAWVERFIPSDFQEGPDTQ
jgi:serine/threonine protein kinase